MIPGKPTPAIEPQPLVVEVHPPTAESPARIVLPVGSGIVIALGTAASPAGSGYAATVVGALVQSFLDGGLNPLG